MTADQYLAPTPHPRRQEPLMDHVTAGDDTDAVTKRRHRLVKVLGAWTGCERCGRGRGA